MSKQDQYTMTDPRTQYNNDGTHYNDDQPDPALDKKLDPSADHGENTYRGSDRLKGRKALVTGGDSGIGRAVAIAFAREGADVVINYLPSEQEDGDKTVAILEEAGVKAKGIAGDIKNEDFCISLVEEANAFLDGLDILVNNAGKQKFIENIEDITTEQFRTTFETNVFAMFWITKAAAKHMPPGGSIINSTSIQCYQPSPGLLDYSSTKGAITSFTKSCAKMLIEKGIRVNGVAPGPIWTPIQQSGGQAPSKLPKFGEDTPIGRAGQPAELAPAYVYLASQESSYVTAEILGVTGGKHLP
ncbi:NAD(P)-dependent oxidoreductase [Alteromonas mediterranea]|uniref:SDR family oxidoreductase n=1 Tax=Alteromonas mediterranea TaxID=314275 RepID=UPI000903B6EE|nr:SDR family oxidoreductase [Alteromonas mediterranea]APD94518.1 NAD(P)-dependent oxidoreductase [Alteromonas mediterranea]APD98150.1 NAD(P)-dependent oxidoreductase [Alteromonas mediterranea]QGX62270.1 SDR family oxidoreductase [Alteromonas mediterranea]